MALKKGVETNVVDIEELFVDNLVEVVLAKKEGVGTNVVDTIESVVVEEEEVLVRIVVVDDSSTDDATDVEEVVDS